MTICGPQVYSLFTTAGLSAQLSSINFELCLILFLDIFVFVQLLQSDVAQKIPRDSRHKLSDSKIAQKIVSEVFGGCKIVAEAFLLAKID